MPVLTTDDGVKLHYEEVGSGTPIVFVHEFAGDCRSWEAQMRLFRASLSLHRVQRARLSAIRRARQCCEIFAGSRARRHQSRARWAQARQGAHRRLVDGRLRNAALRLHLPAAGAVAGRRRLRLRRFRRQEGAVRRGGRSGGGAVRATGNGQGRRRLCVGSVARAVPEQGSRAAGASLPINWPATRHVARR